MRLWALIVSAHALLRLRQEQTPALPDRAAGSGNARQTDAILKAQWDAMFPTTPPPMNVTVPCPAMPMNYTPPMPCTRIMNITYNVTNFTMPTLMPLPPRNCTPVLPRPQPCRPYDLQMISTDPDMVNSDSVNATWFAMSVASRIAAAVGVSADRILVWPEMGMNAQPPPPRNYTFGPPCQLAPATCPIGNCRCPLALVEYGHHTDTMKLEVHLRERRVSLRQAPVEAAPPGPAPIEAPLATPFPEPTIDCPMECQLIRMKTWRQKPIEEVPYSALMRATTTPPPMALQDGVVALGPDPGGKQQTTFNGVNAIDVAKAAHDLSSSTLHDTLQLYNALGKGAEAYNAQLNTFVYQPGPVPVSGPLPPKRSIPFRDPVGPQTWSAVENELTATTTPLPAATVPLPLPLQAAPTPPSPVARMRNGTMPGPPVAR